MTTEEMIIYDEMVELGVCTADELGLVKGTMGGSWNDVFNAICFYRTGFGTWNEYIQDCMEEE